MTRSLFRSLTMALLGLGCLVMLTGCATGRPDLEGAWMLVRPEPADAAHPTVKVLADGRFAFGRRTSGIPGPLAGGGAYRQDDGVYIETIEYHWAPALVGRTVTFTCRIEDGRWIHQARFEAGGQTFVIDEEWVRLAD